MQLLLHREAGQTGESELTNNSPWILWSATLWDPKCALRLGGRITNTSQVLRLVNV